MTASQPAADAPAATVPVDEGVRDFSKHRQIRFRLNHANKEPDYFDGVPGLPALVLVEFAALSGDMREDAPLSDQVKLFQDLFSMVLTEESSERFLSRMGDKKDPIDFEQINDILPYLMEQYGMRPTLPSSDSSTGSASPDTGTSSTETAPKQVSTPSTLPAIGS